MLLRELEVWLGYTQRWSMQLWMSTLLHAPDAYQTLTAPAAYCTSHLLHALVAYYMRWTLTTCTRHFLHAPNAYYMH